MMVFDWLLMWDESVVFGLAIVLVLLGVECAVLARKSYLRTRTALDEGALLGAEFGVFTAPSAELIGEPEVPLNCYLLAAAGTASMTAAFVLLGFAVI